MKASPRETAGIILAAGMSTRLGKSKQLVTIGDRNVIQRIIDAAASSHLSRLFLVLGPRSNDIQELVQERIDKHQIQVIINSDFARGMSTSLKVGLKAAIDFPAAMILLGDQPFIGSPLINTLLKTLWQSESLIAAPTCQGRRRNPVVFDKSLYPEILAVSGDQGARELLIRHKNKTALVDFANPNLFLDIDTAEDVETALKQVD